ncbi:unnamed protein product [Hermetia illucens]|uniref:Uncharacterized protein n=1 Tax=Hermetia illucens TaxID=343691 RepID=A0A7R8U9Y0_HERIL|nr:unnamed protein product [Hermetia illucens]
MIRSLAWTKEQNVSFIRIAIYVVFKLQIYFLLCVFKVSFRLTAKLAQNVLEDVEPFVKSAKSWFSLCRLPIVKEKLAGKWSAAWLDGVTCFESEKA